MNWHYLARLALSIGIGALGGAIFAALSMPLPWMLGAMCFTFAAAVVRLPIISARRIRPPLAAVIGIALGSRFTGETFGKLAGWLPITAAVVLATVLVGLAGYVYLRLVAGCDPVTAYFAAAPGGLYEMTMQGGLAGGDENRIALTHAVRIFLVALLVPMLFRVTNTLQPMASGGSSSAVYVWSDVLVLSFCIAGQDAALPEPASHWPAAAERGGPSGRSDLSLLREPP